MAAASGEAVQEDGYHGGYILDLAAQINREHPEFRQLPAEEQLVAFREEAYALQWQQQKDVLNFFERTLMCGIPSANFMTPVRLSGPKLASRLRVTCLNLRAPSGYGLRHLETIKIG